MLVLWGVVAVMRLPVPLLIAPVAIILGAAVRGAVLSPNAFAGFALLALGFAILDGRTWVALRRGVDRAGTRS